MKHHCEIARPRASDAFRILALLAILMISIRPQADGTEELGAPDIPIAAGTGVVAAGVGLVGVSSGTISFSVPLGASVEQVLLYWEGTSFGTGLPAEIVDEEKITVGSSDVTGLLIGGHTAITIGGPYTTATYRADITALGLVAPGANNIDVSGANFSRFNNGAGILVIIDDGSGAASIDLRDGNDFAFEPSPIADPASLKTTVPQTFTFPALTAPVTAKLDMFFSSVEGDASGLGDRPHQIKITVGATETILQNPLDSSDGDEWDTLRLEIDLFPGDTSVTVEAISTVDPANPSLTPASLVWNAAAFTLPPPPPSNPGTGTPGYWKTHPEAWCEDSIEIGGVTYSKADAIKLMFKPPAGDVTLILFSQLVAAKLNVCIGNDSSCIAEVIADADAWFSVYPPCSRVRASSSAWKLGELFKDELDDYNNGLLCAPSRDSLE